MNVKLKHIIIFLGVLFILWLNYLMIDALFINYEEQKDNSGWCLLIVMEIIALASILLNYLPQYWNKTIIKINKIN